MSIRTAAQQLIGRTIVAAKIKKLRGYDDEPILELSFRDGSSAVIEANYGSYTGRSEDEYPRWIDVTFRPKAGTASRSEADESKRI